MNKLKREDFLKMGALALCNPFSNGFLQQVANAGTGKKALMKDELLKRLVTANDAQVAKLLPTIELEKIHFGRKIGYDFTALAASYSCPDSAYYHLPLIVSKLGVLTAVLQKFQSEDGTVNIGNLESPPDTAFLIELLAPGAAILLKDKSGDLSSVNKTIQTFLLRSGNALSTGGVHTPNHRWVICAALSHLNAIYPDKKYLHRIEDWLGEGVFIDADGHFPERSSIYSSVENNALIIMARLLNKPALFAPVRKNLAMMYYYMEPNGDLVSTDSRRQDQYISKTTIVGYYLHYRYMAIRDNNSGFAGIARMIEQLPGFELEVLPNALYQFLENPLLQQEMPQSNVPADQYEKLFDTSHLLRIRRGSKSTTVFGGVDWPVIIASGRSNSPNIYACRNGKAILKYLRLSSGFFGMGYFYSDGLKKLGTKYILHKKNTVPYYQPLPKNLRNSKGDYKLSPSIDDRFWNKMDFEHRPVSNVKALDTTVVFEEVNGTNELTFTVTGFTGVPVTIELCFLEGGKLSGVTEASNGNTFLQKGMGKYEFAGESISFGPGTMAHQSVDGLEGEKYSTHFGTLRTEGMHVYLTGITPFTHKIVIA